MVGTTFKVGTRGSKLALAQAATLLAALRAANPGIRFERVIVQTSGDRDRTSPLAAIGVGVFVKELESALAARHIDLAVHSAKDLPTDTPDGFHIAAFMEREDPRDVLVSRHVGGISGLPRGARVGTGSSRRRSLLLALRPDMNIEPIRGNVDTRLSKLRAPDGPDAIVLAAAGLSRLGRLDEVSEFLDPATFVPAVGQGALAVETRSDDVEAIATAKSVEHAQTRSAVEAERAFLRAAGGGCSAPVAGHGVVHGDRLTLAVLVSDLDGRRLLRHTATGFANNAAGLGLRAAETLIAQGAHALLAASRNQSPADTGTTPDD